MRALKNGITKECLHIWKKEEDRLDIYITLYIDNTHIHSLNIGAINFIKQTTMDKKTGKSKYRVTFNILMNSPSKQQKSTKEPQI